MVFLLSRMMLSASFGDDESSSFPSDDGNAGENSLSFLSFFDAVSIAKLGVFLLDANSRVWLRLLPGREGSVRSSNGLLGCKFVPTERDLDRCDVIRLEDGSPGSSGSRLIRKVCNC